MRTISVFLLAASFACGTAEPLEAIPQTPSESSTPLWETMRFDGLFQASWAAANYQDSRIFTDIDRHKTTQEIPAGPTETTCTSYDNTIRNYLSYASGDDLLPSFAPGMHDPTADYAQLEQPAVLRQGDVERTLSPGTRHSSSRVAQESETGELHTLHLNGELAASLTVPKPVELLEPLRGFDHELTTIRWVPRDPESLVQVTLWDRNTVATCYTRDSGELDVAGLHPFAHHVSVQWLRFSASTDVQNFLHVQYASMTASSTAVLYE